MRRKLLPLLLTAAVIAFPGGAAAAWVLHASGGGAAKAKTLGPGNAPAGTVTGHKVKVSWTASSYTNGGAPAGYIINRYNASTGVLQTILSACTGTINALTCTESSVPSGNWQYTVTPVTANWRGPESAKSAVVAV